MNIIKVPQNQETKTEQQKLHQYAFRYAYARSHDSRKNNSSGQDYLVINADKQRISFVLCDGVSQSYFGEIAARLIGDQLIGSMADRPESALGENFKEDLTTLLQDMILIGQEKVAEHIPNEKISPMIQQVLAEKKKTGSETTFIAGLIDFKTNQCLTAWMGDSRLRIWGDTGEISQELLGDQFHTKERWSTSRGMVGELHTAKFPLEQIKMISLYSDGMAFLDKINLENKLSKQALDSIIDELGTQPNSDDISFLQIWLQADAQGVEKTRILPAPQTVTAKVTNDLLQITWDEVAGAQTYKIRLMSGKNMRYFITIDTSWESDTDRINAEELQVQVAAFSGLEPGKWSDPITVKLPQKPKTPAIQQGTGSPGRKLNIPSPTPPTPQTGNAPQKTNLPHTPRTSAPQPAPRKTQGPRHPQQPQKKKKPPFIQITVMIFAATVMLCLGVFITTRILKNIRENQTSNQTATASAMQEEIQKQTDQAVGPVVPSISTPITPTFEDAPTLTITSTNPPTSTITLSPTITLTPTITLSPTISNTPTITNTPTSTLVPTITNTPNDQPSPTPESPTTPGSIDVLELIDINGGDTVMVAEVNITHPVNPFRIMKYEVTIGDFAAFLEANPNIQPASGDLWRQPLDQDRPNAESLPVTRITSEEAIQYCQWRFVTESTLPTEAQWIRAARGSETTPYVWGENMAIYQNLMKDKDRLFPVTAPFFNEILTPNGVAGMGGSVWEMVFDQFDPTKILIKGGSYLNLNNPEKFLIEYNEPMVDTYDQDIGFRCIVPGPSSPPPQPSGNGQNAP